MKNKELNLAIKIREELNKKGAKLGNASDFIIESVLKENKECKCEYVDINRLGQVAKCIHCGLPES